MTLRPPARPFPPTLLRLMPLLIALVSALALGTALASQYWGGLRPCELCLYQRWPYAINIALGLIAATPFVGRRGRIGLLGLAGFAFLAGALIAIFHVGVEQHWWEGLSTCTAPTGTAKTLEELRAQVLAAPVVRCDEVPWSLFGLSMAGYNMMLSFVLAVVSVAAAGQMSRKEPHR